MNGFGHLPSKIDQNTFVFYANASGSASGSFQAWQIPEHAAFLHFTVIGGGGGGGGGGFYTGAGRRGAGGGAPGGLVAVSIPTILLPKTLYLQVGLGGKGGDRGTTYQTQAGNGGNGEISYVCLYPEVNPGSVIIQSSETPAGGAVGANNISPTAGTAITIANTNNLKWLGIVGNTVAQTAGGAGSTTAPGSVTYAGLLTGGGGAPGYAGVIGGAIIMTSINGYNNATVAGGNEAINEGNGNCGYFSWRPFIATGGSGGAASSVASRWGGSGGDGAFGCGGGGAGNTTTNSLPTTGQGGYGGKGGDGLIIISVS